MSRRRRRGGRAGGRARGSSVRVTRTKNGKTTSSHTGGLSISGASPTGRISGARPTVRATVVDRGTTLSKGDIRLYLDGSEKSRFRYDPSSGQLSFYVGNALSPGAHEVRIEAESRSSGGQAQVGGTSSRRWTFTVARR